jgi:hypothetical protein
VRMGDLAYGEGKDLLRATHAYERAARLRNAEASFNLGWMHAAGLVSRPDAFLAKRYFDQAREMDRDAVLPATIAVYALRYHATAVELAERWGRWLDESRRAFDAASRASSGDAEGDLLDPASPFRADQDVWARYGDLGVCLVLFGLLAVIVNARQRRLVEDNPPANDGGDVLDAVGLGDPVDDLVDGRPAGRGEGGQ